MFCPLCQSEYRADITHCTECRAALVATPDSPEARANPPRILWRAPIAELFAAITNRLEEEAIPCLALEQESPLLRGFRPHFEIQVLESDFAHALKSGVEAVESLNPRMGWLESCPACNAQQPAGFSKCGACGAWLLSAEVALDAASSRSPDSPAVQYAGEPLGKHCNLCGLVYQVKYTHCSACGNELTDGLAPSFPRSAREAREPLTIVWKGSDPVALSRIVCALRRAGIRAFTKSTEDHLVFSLGMPRPRYEINVFQSDYETARYFVVPIRESLPFESLEPHAAAQEVAQPEPLNPAPTSPRVPLTLTGEWSPARATIEIWSGDDSGLADMLARCLAENRIGFRCQGASPSTQHFFVCPEESPHAAEIVAAIVDSVS